MHATPIIDVRQCASRSALQSYLRQSDKQRSAALRHGPGGWGGIRTHGRLSPTAVFKTAALNHSATHPCRPDARAFAQERDKVQGE